jgi:hypothetical protein
MASAKRPPSDSQRRRRPPPVINLEATEVESRPVAAPPNVDAPTQPLQTETAPPPKSDDTFIPPPVSPMHAASEPPTEPPPEPPRGPSRPPPEPPPKRGPFAWLPEELSWAQASAGIAGAAGGLLLFLLLWLVGAFSGGRESSADPSPRLASIEKQLKDLATRPAPASADPKAIEEVAARVGRLESAQSTPRAPVTDPVVLGRLSATENAVKSLADNAAALSRRADAVDGTLRNLQSRLDKMSANLSELQTNARAAAAGSDRSARLAVAAAALRDAVERGEPFAAELAVVKPLASDANPLAPLEPFAASGVPSNAALGQELAAIIRPMQRAADAPQRDGSILDRLQANAEKLVRIRPVDEARGDDPGAILARIEQRATHANISGALAELAKLPPAARAPAQAWIAKAEARNVAIEASRRLAANAVAALKATP